MTLVETNADETDADFRVAVDALLQEVAPDRPRWWHPYEVRGTYECRSVRFRHFYCIAGSVEGWMWSIANKNGPRRVILLTDESVTVFGPVKMYGRGEEVVIKPAEVQAVRPSA
jgi:hypothetical protein